VERGLPNSHNIFSCTAFVSSRSALAKALDWGGASRRSARESKGPKLRVRISSYRKSFFLLRFGNCLNSLFRTYTNSGLVIPRIRIFISRKDLPLGVNPFLVAAKENCPSSSFCNRDAMFIQGPTKSLPLPIDVIWPRAIPHRSLGGGLVNFLLSLGNSSRL